MTIAPNLQAQLGEEHKANNYHRPSVMPGHRMSVRAATVDAEVQTESEPLRQFQEMEVQTDPKSLVSTKI